MLLTSWGPFRSSCDDRGHFPYLLSHSVEGAFREQRDYDSQQYSFCPRLLVIEVLSAGRPGEAQGLLSLI